MMKMKVSEVTLATLKNYIRVDHDEDDVLLEAILVGAKAFIKGFAGLDILDFDKYEDTTIALLVLCSEMYDNRSYSVDNHEVNPVVRTILQMYSTNNL
jgi:uncharacterized phage protein (predicted DNA packaging)